MGVISRPGVQNGMLPKMRTGTWGWEDGGQGLAELCSQRAQRTFSHQAAEGEWCHCQCERWGSSGRRKVT